MGGTTLVEQEPAVTPAGEETAAVPQDPAPAAELGTRRVRLVFLGLMLALLLAALDQMIVATALPKIVGELHGLDRMSWAITAYLLTSTIGLPLSIAFSGLLGHPPASPQVEGVVAEYRRLWQKLVVSSPKLWSQAVRRLNFIQNSDRMQSSCSASRIWSPETK